MYAILGTRPDLAFAVSVVSQYSSKPNDSHWQAVKRIFRYIKGTLDLQLTFRGPLTALTGYTDADWAGDQDTRRSTSGFVFNLGSGAISWSSKRQPNVILSSCEAEYMGQTQAVKEAVWLKSLLDQLSPPSNADSNSSTQIDSNHLPTPTVSGTLPSTNSAVSLPNINSFVASDPYPDFAFSAVVIYCDNQGAIALAKNPESHARSKHIDIQWHYQREKIEDGSVEFKFIPTEQQIADGLTKALTKEKFLIFRQALGLEEYRSES